MQTASFPNEPEQVGKTSAWPKTFWPEVWAAAQALGRDLVPLQNLCVKYRQPVDSFLRHHFRNYPKILSQSEDLLQGFFADCVLKDGWLARADREKGSFRGYLCRGVISYVIDWWRKQPEYVPPVRKPSKPEERAGKPPSDQTGGRRRFIAEPLPDEDILAAPSAEILAFDLEWLRCVLAEALDRMELRCKGPGKNQREARLIWEIFRIRKLDPIFLDLPPVPYEQLTRELGLKSPNEGHFLLDTAKRMLEGCFYDVVSEYAGDSRATRIEMRQLTLVAQSLRDQRRSTRLRPKPRDAIQLLQQEAGGSPRTPSYASRHLLPGSSERLRRLEEIRADARESWTPEDLRQMVEHQLSAELKFDLGSVATDSEGTKRIESLLDGSRVKGLRTFGELLCSPTPSVEVLDLCRRFFKLRAIGREDGFEAQIAYVFYVVSIAAALVRCNERITQMPDTKFEEALETVLTYPWITHEVRELLAKARRCLLRPEEHR